MPTSLVFTAWRGRRSAQDELLQHPERCAVSTLVCPGAAGLPLRRAAQAPARPRATLEPSRQVAATANTPFSPPRGARFAVKRDARARQVAAAARPPYSLPRGALIGVNRDARARQVDAIARMSYSLPCSAFQNLNMDGLLERMWTSMALVRVYTKRARPRAWRRRRPRRPARSR